MSQLHDDLAIAPPRPADVVARIQRVLHPRGRSGLVALAAGAAFGVVVTCVHPANAPVAIAMLPGMGMEVSRLRMARRFARDGVLVRGVARPIDVRAIVTIDAADAPLPLRFTINLPGLVGDVQILMLPGTRSRRIYVVGPSGIVACKVDLDGLPRAQLRG